MEAYLDLDQWCYMLGRIEDHLRSAHGRGVYLEMEGAFWNMYCGLPRVSCPECGFTVTLCDLGVEHEGAGRHVGMGQER